MSFADLGYVFNWWVVLFLIGIIFLPLTTKIFSSFFDRGYIFSKVLGMLIVSYVIFLLGTLKILPFTEPAVFLVVAFFLMINIFFFTKALPSLRWNLVRQSWKIFAFEELLFFVALLFWSFIRGHEPSIHGLEKYMDFGFVNSILRSDYFPPQDIWYTPLPINYYYFGHLVTAVLTKLSGIDSVITYNLMIATLFALTFTGAFSIVMNLLHQRKRGVTRMEGLPTARRSFELTRLDRALAGGKSEAGPRAIIGGLLTAFLITLAGNLHIIYSFFKPYLTDSPLPFWQLPFSPEMFPNAYWYPNATRFIENTIHEFPIYSFVVSDLHGHVLDIPVVLLMIALLLSVILNSVQDLDSDLRQNDILVLPLLSFLIAVMYMTNVWDTLIYGGLTFLVFFYLGWQSKNLLRYLPLVVLVLIGSIIFTLPFSLHFTPFISGIGIVCAPEFLTNIGKLGPFLFEADHCQRSPFWQLLILYGFFYFFVISFIILNFRHWKFSPSNMFVLMLIITSTLLIIVPEFFYAKDIYPAHYRANTMFKLGYQAFMMLSIVSGYAMLRIISNYWKLGYWVIGSIGLLLVSIYPFFAITSYYGSLQTYHSLDGLAYLKSLYPQDYDAIVWLNKNVKRQPVVLEANGDSYTDYARVSSNTGLPTVIGWPVHEWLWRGSYDVAAPRIADVQRLYETTDLPTAQQLIKKYNIELVFVGDLERQKYPNLSELKFERLGNVIFQTGQTRIYQLGSFPR